jgi:hypothetical protein
MRKLATPEYHGNERFVASGQRVFVPRPSGAYVIEYRSSPTITPVASIPTMHRVDVAVDTVKVMRLIAAEAVGKATLRSAPT